MGKKVTVTRVFDVTELGRAGGRATAANRTPQERKQASQSAAKARWEAYYAANPDKLKAKLAKKKGKTK
jgi:hypothetical protein